MMYLSIILVFIGCAHQGSLSIKSQPAGAKVLIYKAQDKSYQEVGQTPLRIDRKILKEKGLRVGDYFSLKIIKEGHVIENLIYDHTSKEKMDYVVDLKPIEAWNSKDGEVPSYMANIIAEKLQKINRLIFNREYENALIKIEDLIEQYPKASVFYDMKGSVLLLKGEREKALGTFRKSQSLNPESIETQNIVKKLTREVAGQGSEI